MRIYPVLALLAACVAPDALGTREPGGADPGEEPPVEERVDMIEFPPQATADDPAHVAQLPACASPLAGAMFAGARDVIWRGSVPGDLFATSLNTADTDLLLDGPEIFPAFRELIATAKHHVSLQTYVWESPSDPVTDILAGVRELAARRAAEAPLGPPVTVRFLLDVSLVNFGSTVKALPQLWGELEAMRLDPAHVRFEIAGFYHLTVGNLHAKTLVVDGRDAIITGANPQAHHDYDSPWHDSGARFTGDVAVALLADFDNSWRNGHLWTCGADASKTTDQCIAKADPIIWPVRRPAMAAGTCRTMMVTSRQADANPTSNRLDNPQDQAFLAGWAAAQQHIRIETPNLNDDAAKAALIAAIERGVTVDVVLSKSFNEAAEGIPGQGGGNDMNVRLLYEALAAKGITDGCDRLRVRWYSRDGINAVLDNGNYASHTKYSSIDDQIVIVGTANMDTQSWNNARETNVVVDDAELTTAWDAQLFVADWNRGVRTSYCPAP